MRTMYQLKPKELAEIEKAMRQDKRAEVRQRATVIRLLHLGQKPSEVAEQQMVSVPTIYNWHKLWREEGIEWQWHEASLLSLNYLCIAESYSLRHSLQVLRRF